MRRKLILFFFSPLLRICFGLESDPLAGRRPQHRRLGGETFVTDSDKKCIFLRHTFTDRFDHEKVTAWLAGSLFRLWWWSVIIAHIKISPKNLQSTHLRNLNLGVASRREDGLILLGSWKSLVGVCALSHLDSKSKATLKTFKLPLILLHKHILRGQDKGAFAQSWTITWGDTSVIRRSATELAKAAWRHLRRPMFQLF